MTLYEIRGGKSVTKTGFHSSVFDFLLPNIMAHLLYTHCDQPQMYMTNVTDSATYRIILSSVF
jgi:hypothetical protein